MEWLILSLAFILSAVFSALNITHKPYKDWNINAQKIWRAVLILVPMSTVLFLKEFTLFSVLIYVMLLFALVGDILIIKNLLGGLIAFFICHALNSVNFFIANGTISAYSILIGAVVYAFGLFIFSILFLGKIKGLMGILVPIYLVVILFSVWQSYSLFLSTHHLLSALLTSVGTTLFFFTDTQVANESMLNNRIMNNYIVDQILNNIFYYGSLICLTASAFIF
jgi:hypothetical protein